MGKATRHVGLRVSEEDLAKLLRAAQAAWPGARMSQASIIVSLALREADRVIAESPTARKKK